MNPESWAWGTRTAVTVGLVELHTDVGTTGLGEVAACMGPNEETLRAMTSQFAASIVGESALAPQRIVTRVRSAGWYALHRTAALVVGGLEMACWDALGKHLGVPVSTLFGGSIKETFASMYYVQSHDDMSSMVEEAKESVSLGFGTIYFKVGFEEERDIELVRRMRESVGSGPRIRIDANEAWSPGTAVRILRRMEPSVIEYIEQPVSMYDLEGLAHVRAASGVPVGANQTSWGVHAVLDIIRRNAADVIMSDPHQEGGLLPTKQVLGICEAAGLPFVNHAFNPTTITLSSHLQVMSTSSSCILAVQGHPNFLADDYVTEPLDYTGGTLAVGTRPGLGVEIDRVKLAKYAARFDKEGLIGVYPTSQTSPFMAIPAL
jgi:L-alanine-DL-glutamate epimerase-like enolase superfamily enzyme